MPKKKPPPFRPPFPRLPALPLFLLLALFAPLMSELLPGLWPAAAGMARAAEFTALGHWMFGFYGGNVHGQKRDGKDDFEAVQRLRTQFGFRSGHGLDGQIQLEIGKTDWGQASDGGALGADAAIAKLRYAWLDWDAPACGAKVRMGLQPVNMPAFVSGSPLFSEDAAAITASGRFSENLEATAFWARASAGNANPAAGTHGENALPAFSSMDFFGLALPARGDGFRLTPYGMLAVAGINSFGWREQNAAGSSLQPYKSSLRTVAANLSPVGGPDVLADPRASARLDSWAAAWWAGVGGELEIFSPWRLAGELACGRADFGSTRVMGRAFEMRRAGWYGAFIAEYRLDWMIPGLLGWYSSGDDDNPWNGSERMPAGKSANRDWKVLNLAYDGAPFCPDGGAQIISPNGTMIGTWGIVGRLRDVSFLKKLSHTLSCGYVRGTNAPGMVSSNPMFTDKTPGGYLTMEDEAFELDFETRFSPYENLTLIADADWLRVNWSGVWKHVADDLRRDFYRIGLTLWYHF